MNRGDIVLVAARGEYAGKPRPALVVQSDLFNPTHASITLCLITSTIRAVPLFRPSVEPSPENGLRRRSQVMVDKIFSAPREKIGDPVGRVDDTTMAAIDNALRLWLEV